MEQPSAVNNEDYVTVVAVGSPKFPEEENITKDYVTVLKIGNESTQKEIAEEVLVYRLPGEKLGFGLKFEGGTKSAEFVKRLFIQSCAVNSPASRVQSSWGPLVEGDEVLEIDSVPVNTMTRIDCVRCLKDSNVVIKLLIKHRFDEPLKSEDLPLVVSAEKKRTPPPPPPVPPRKVNRKSKENSIVIPPKGFGDASEPPIPLARQSCGENNIKSRQSPYNSFRKLRQSPEVNKKVRKLSEDGNCPPDAEVYIDLFSQESAYSLSESDDTGSSISTVVDRLGSYPTTTTSSFSGSLPSTPTPVQKHIDLSEDIDFSSENYLFSKLVTSQCEEDVPKTTESNPPLQPPANFQDAPLSYGNEDVKIEETPPSPPPRSRNGIKKEDEISTIELPRLVDFVPKTSSNTITNSIEIVKHFLENEKCYVVMDDNENHINNSWCEDEFYSLEWSPSSKLATIGEDEEETVQEECVSTNIENPVVIIENADSCAVDESSEKCANLTYLYDNKESDLEQTMDIPPIYSRQPPDGHEFPDYHEDNKEQPIVKQISDKPPPIKPREIWRSKCEPPKNNVRDKIAMFSNRPSLTKKYVSTDNITLSDNPERFKTISRSELTLEIKDDTKMKPAQSDLNLSLPKEEEEPVFRKLTGRSMSLCDVSLNRPDKWTAMVEQRRKCLSKLKGLVIPENIPEIEMNVQPFVDLPEIKSEINVPIFSNIKVSPKENPKPNLQRHSSFVTSSPKTPQTPSSTYKLLQKFKTPNEELENEKSPVEFSKLTVNVNNHNQSDPPKSLESITSPTRSDYSFEYIYSPEIKNRTANGFIEKPKITNHLLEDESDNDSALSSSQSSYISKNSPPASPISTPTGHTILSKSDSNYDSLNRRLLKAQSVEAINRKNILASARCRSGRDLKVGSPLIQRKFDEDQKINEEPKQIKTIQKDERVVIEEVKIEKFQVKEMSSPSKIEQEVPIKYEKDTSMKFENETLSKFENETLSKFENETLNKFENETLSKFQNETSSKFENETLSKFQNESLSKFENETLNKFENETLSKFENEASGKFEKESSMKFENQSSMKFENQASGKFEKESSMKFENQASGKFEKESSMKFENQASGKFEKEPSMKFENQSSMKFENQASIKFEKQIPNKFEKIPNKFEKIPNKLEKEASIKFERDSSNKFERDFSNKFERDSSNKFERHSLNKFERDSSNKFERDSSNKFERDFSNKFERDSSNKFERDSSNKFERDSSNKFERDFSNKFERDSSNKFERDFSNKFERDFSNKFEKEASINFEENTNKSEDLSKFEKEKNKFEKETNKFGNDMNKLERESSINFERESSINFERESSINFEKKSPINFDRESSINFEKQSSFERESSINFEKQSSFERESSINFEKQSSINFEKQSSINFEKQSSINFEKQPSIDFGKQSSIDFKKQSSINFEKQSSIDFERESSINFEKEIPFKYEKEIPFKYEKEIPFKYEKEVPFKYQKEIPYTFERETPFKLEKEVPFKYEKETSFKFEKEIPFKYEKETPFKLEKEVPFKLEKEVPFKYEKETTYKFEKETPFKLEKEVPFKYENETQFKLEKEVPFKLEKEAQFKLEKEVPFKYEKETSYKFEKEVPFKLEKEVPFKYEKETSYKFEKEIPFKLEKEAQFKLEKEVPFKYEKETSYKFEKEVPFKFEKEAPFKFEKEALIKFDKFATKFEKEGSIKFDKEVPKKQTPIVDLSKTRNFVKAASVNDLRKNFEKEPTTPSPRNSICKTPEPKPTKRMSIPQIQPEIRDNSINNDESSQDINKIKTMVLDEYGIIPEVDLKIVFLKPDVSGGSIGITLAGGADYETKEITIHKIRTGSPAYRDGRLQKGDRILFINGKIMRELSHSESLKVLKENVPQVTIVACSSKDISVCQSPRRQLSTDSGIQMNKKVEENKEEVKSSGEAIEVTIHKDVAGLGFSIQGGQDSPQGNVPLVIKKLFVGGAAEKSGKLQIGDELLEINGVDVTFLSRIDAWNVMKKLPEGDIVIRVRR